MAFRLALVLAVFPTIATAQSLDIAGPYGNEPGCKVVRGEAKASEESLVVRPDRFDYATNSCDFVQVLKARDGTSVVTALCQLEDEEGRSVSLFSVSKSKVDADAFIIRDEYGASWDPVKPCAAAP